MSKDLFKNLIEAVVALAADEVVKLLDRNRDANADLAKLLYVDMGAAEHIVKRQPFEVQLRLLDSKREPVAGAARNLHMVHGFDEVQLNRGCRESIIGKAVALNRTSIGDIKGGMRCVGIHPVYALWKPAYPDRERTADSAQYLWKNQVAGDWVASLKIYTPLQIREFACGRQKRLCTEVADAAWIAFDEGGYRLDLKCGSVERILDLAIRAKALREALRNTTIELTAAEVSSGLDRVKWAEGLIKQLPEDHEGRNSWLMNYGQKAVQAADTAERVAK